mmetsp:Transcript_11412/g.28096  ORF Transcript_11412/g.28096 Transcript_11412/m.28096 type:complete len:124 (-) Transcript_11412:400-771(-)|eukprot:CAMPEP_0114518602 /NCGR_PEP_ID=MMETSP0109-20121206/18531_1 /TAXON_ID=29199 /ORGANISM="Chlorarachnion reptans, Strain CCCM449" /LENGTH=123 /DNA_ID=CAMNT_0001699233 /DNA_START=37 /DNA_END=408 /DNA_ORIENTATION=+
MNQEGRDAFSYLKKQRENEAVGAKMWRKFKEDPLVPTFFGLTCFALVGGLRAMGRGDSMRSNVFMRYRVAAQSCCLVALAYAGYRGRLIVDRDGNRAPGAGGDIQKSGSYKMPPGIPPPPPGK